MTKEEWIQIFEEIHNRKPTTSEFLEAKNSGEFIVEETPKETISQEVLQKVAPENVNKVEMDDNLTIFCTNCGSINEQDCAFCVSCGENLSESYEYDEISEDNGNGLRIDSSLLTNFSSKLKDLTHSAQTQTQIFKLKKQRDNLLKSLGKAYYEMYASSPNEGLESLIADINKCEQEIHLYSEQLSKK